MNDLQLTKESIANEGIEIKITQADVIDALVDDQMEIILNRYEDIQAKSDYLYQKREQIKNDARDKAFEEAKKKLPKNIKIMEGVEVHTYQKHLANEKSIEFLHLSKYTSNNGIIEFRKGQNSDLYSCTITSDASIYIDVQVKDLKIVGSILKFEFSFKYPASFIKEVKENNKVVRQFLEEFPEPISPSKISKTIKNKFTKEILRTSSPDFKKKLKAGFGLTL
jgi:hypothetical protein